MDVTQSSQEQAVKQPESNAKQLQGLLSQARGTRQMLLDFKGALDDCTVHGSHVYALALGLQFVTQLINQSKGDIDSIQKKIDAEHKQPASVEAEVVEVK